VEQEKETLGAAGNVALNLRSMVIDVGAAFLSADHFPLLDSNRDPDWRKLKNRHSHKRP
jgi:hypothetical protein